MLVNAKPLFPLWQPRQKAGESEEKMGDGIPFLEAARAGRLERMRANIA